MDCELPSFSVHVILQARILSGLSFPSPTDLPNPGILHCKQILYYLSHVKLYVYKQLFSYRERW